jgi:hypothetical protein
MGCVTLHSETASCDHGVWASMGARLWVVVATLAPGLSWDLGGGGGLAAELQAHCWRACLGMNAPHISVSAALEGEEPCLAGGVVTGGAGLHIVTTLLWRGGGRCRLVPAQPHLKRRLQMQCTDVAATPLMSRPPFTWPPI